MAEIEFVDPPTKVMYDWAEIAATARANPGKWIRVFEKDRTSLVTAFKLNGLKDLPTDEFEVRTSNNTREYVDADGVKHPRQCSMFLRYIKKERP